jgi:hypothetical protein
MCKSRKCGRKSQYMCQFEHETLVIYTAVFVDKKIAFADKCNNDDSCTVYILLVLSHSKSTALNKITKHCKSLLRLSPIIFSFKRAFSVHFVASQSIFHDLFISALVRKNYGLFKICSKVAISDNIAQALRSIGTANNAPVASPIRSCRARAGDAGKGIPF